MSYIFFDKDVVEYRVIVQAIVLPEVTVSVPIYPDIKSPSAKEGSCL